MVVWPERDESKRNLKESVVAYPKYRVQASWNMMAHAQKPDFVFRLHGRVHLNHRGASVQSTTGSRGVRISGSNAGYTMFRGSVKGTRYPLHSPVSPSLPLPCVTVCHHISTGVYNIRPEGRVFIQNSRCSFRNTKGRSAKTSLNHLYCTSMLRPLQWNKAPKRRHSLKFACI